LLGNLAEKLFRLLSYTSTKNVEGGGGRGKFGKIFPNWKSFPLSAKRKELHFFVEYYHFNRSSFSAATSNSAPALNQAAFSFRAKFSFVHKLCAPQIQFGAVFAPSRPLHRSPEV